MRENKTGTKRSEKRILKAIAMYRAELKNENFCCIYRMLKKATVKAFK